MIVWLPSYPRSGNTLVRMTLHQAMGFDTYSVHAVRQHEREGIHEMLGEKLLPTHGEMRRATKPHFVKTHELWHPSLGKDDKAILIVRDGRDAILSHAYYRMAFNDGKDFDFEIQKLARSHFWTNVVQSWKPRAVVVRYEELVLNPVGVVNQALTWLDLPHEVVGDVPPFDELHRMDAEFFRCGTVGQWRIGLSDYARQEFMKRNGETMKDFGYV